MLVTYALGWLPFALLLSLATGINFLMATIYPLLSIFLGFVGFSIGHIAFWIHLTLVVSIASGTLLPFIKEEWQRIANGAIALVFLYYILLSVFALKLAQH